MSRPVFMSADHVDQMNVILQDASSVHAVCRDLDRRYTVCYELHDGPQGQQVHWSMVFDPALGVRMGLDRLEHADLTLVGDWVDAIRAAEAQRRGEQHDAGMEMRGNTKVLETVGAAHVAAQQVAVVDIVFPDLPAPSAESSADAATR